MVTRMKGTFEVFRHLQVLRTLVGRDLQRQYSKFRLSYLWTFLEPLGMILTFYFVFNLLLGRSRPLGLQPYLLFLSLAILPWWWFQRCITGATKTFRRAGRQVRVSTLPRQIWVARTVVVGGVEFIISLPIAVVAAVITLSAPNIYLLLFPLAIAMQFVVCYGLALMVAAWVTVVPDLGRLIRMGVRVLFYLSPVIYSLSNIPEALQTVSAVNPIVGILGLYRAGFWASEAEAWPLLLVSLASSLVILLAGALTFSRLESRILKAV